MPSVFGGARKRRVSRKSAKKAAPKRKSAGTKRRSRRVSRKSAKKAAPKRRKSRKSAKKSRR